MSPDETFYDKQATMEAEKLREKVEALSEEAKKQTYKKGQCVLQEKPKWPEAWRVFLIMRKGYSLWRHQLFFWGGEQLNGNVIIFPFTVVHVMETVFRAVIFKESLLIAH